MCQACCEECDRDNHGECIRYYGYPMFCECPTHEMYSKE